MSSEIENIVTTNDDLYRALSNEDLRTDARTKEVLRYGSAVWHGFETLNNGGRLDIPLLERLAQEVLGEPMRIRRGPGTRIGNPRTQEIVYTPPEGQPLLLQLLNNLLGYLSASDGIEPLAKLAVGHYQLEAIHPFRDGNGRVGRILNVLYLVQQGLLDQPILYLSRAILDDKATYYRGIRSVTEQQSWEPWILYMIEAIQTTALETRRRIEVIRREIDQAAMVARQSMRRGYSQDLVNLIFEQPYTRIRFLERAGIAKRQAASEYLRELERAGLLRGEKRGREMYYINEGLLRALSA